MMGCLLRMNDHPHDRCFGEHPDCMSGLPFKICLLLAVSSVSPDTSTELVSYCMAAGCAACLAPSTDAHQIRTCLLYLLELRNPSAHHALSVWSSQPVCYQFCCLKIVCHFKLLCVRNAENLSVLPVCHFYSSFYPVSYTPLLVLLCLHIVVTYIITYLRWSRFDFLHCFISFSTSSFIENIRPRQILCNIGTTEFPFP